MKLERLPEDRHKEAVEFLAGVFATSPDEPFLNRELRHWKYYRPHPFSEETRCYVFRDAQGLVAHGGFCPVQYATNAGIKSSFQVIDWAGAQTITWKLDLCCFGSFGRKRILTSASVDRVM